MLQNESETDRVVRVVLGTLLLLIGFSVGRDWWVWVMYVVGGVLLLTGITGFCLVYKLLGIKTTK